MFARGVHLYLVPLEEWSRASTFKIYIVYYYLLSKSLNDLHMTYMYESYVYMFNKKI